MSAFTPEKLAYMEAHKDDSRVSEIRWVYSVPIAASFVSTSLRLWAKKAGRNGITLDDYLIVFATVRYSTYLLFSYLIAMLDLSHRRVCKWPRLWYGLALESTSLDANHNNRSTPRNGETCHCRLCKRFDNLSTGLSRTKRVLQYPLTKCRAIMSSAISTISHSSASNSVSSRSITASLSFRYSERLFLRLPPSSLHGGLASQSHLRSHVGL